MSDTRFVLVVLDRDTELVPGLTKAQLRAIAQRTTELALKSNMPIFTVPEAEDGIAAREARKAARRVA